MNRALRILAKLRGRTPAELHERLGQAASAWRERRGAAGRGEAAIPPAALPRYLAAGVPADPAELLERFRRRAPARFFPGLADPVGTVAALRARCPHEETAVLARAERLLAGRFDLLGCEGLEFGEPIDWHLDPVAGRRAPLVHWSRVPYLDVATVGDHKVVWELNRMQWLVTLGQAWCYTRDERYADAFARAVTSWLDANPPKLGINWASSLEVAFRAMAWLWALHLFRDARALTPALFARVLGALELHGRHLERHLSTYFSPNTHLTGEALGLVHLGLLLPELASAPRWRRHGLAVLETWLPRHVRADGTYFEQATQYHRYTTEFYLHLLMLAEANGVRLGASVRPTVQRLCEVLLYLQRPDGTIPLFGDDDGGRLVQLDDRWPSDVRALLATAGAVLGRGDFVWAGRGEIASVLWLAGPTGLERMDALPTHPPRERSRGFPDGGFYALRDGWGTDADWIAADAGPHGVMNCGHAHADALAFELAVGGRPVLVDAGTYVYHQPDRNTFRSAAAHNAVIIDDVPSSVATSAFQWAHIAHGVGERVLTGGPVELWEGAHDGYRRLPDPVAVRRAVLAVQGHYWLLRDRAVAAGEHRLDWRFQLAPGLGTCMSHDGVMVLDDDGAEVVRLVAPAAGLSWQVTDGWVSPTYGRRDRAPVIAAARQGLGAQDVLIWMLPQRAPWRGAHPASVPSEGGCAFALRGDGVEDLVLAGRGGALRAEGVETDAEWLWLRRRPDGSGECVSIGASWLHIGGRRVFEARERAPYRMDELPGGAGVPAVAP